MPRHPLVFGKTVQIVQAGQVHQFHILSPSNSLRRAFDGSAGQLPTRAPAPVRRLNSVDLPVLGIPTRRCVLLMGVREKASGVRRRHVKRSQLLRAGRS